MNLFQMGNNNHLDIEIPPEYVNASLELTIYVLQGNLLHGVVVAF